MDKVSFAFPVSYSASPKYLPMLEDMSEMIEKCYGLKYSSDNLLRKEIKEKLIITSLPLRINHYILDAFRKVFHYPDYYSYLNKVIILDSFCQ